MPDSSPVSTPFEKVYDAETASNLSTYRTSLPTPGSLRIHQVLPIATTVKVVRCMVGEVSDKGSWNIASKAVCQFTKFFRSSFNVNLTSAKRLWSACEEYFQDDEDKFSQVLKGSTTLLTSCGPMRAHLKARKRRDRQKAPGVEALQTDVEDEFESL